MANDSRAANSEQRTADRGQRTADDGNGLSNYCRQIEAYLCNKNEGHLIRIVGPAFEQVRGWAQQGVPLKIAFRGIDRYCERYYAKGPKRRPVRIEFCEADILELFDDWRRAVGVPGAALAVEERSPRRPSLVSHVERCIARLTAARAGGRSTPEFDRVVDDTVRELDRMADGARHARGDERTRILTRLSELDGALTTAAVASMDAADPSRSASLLREAEEELAPFRARMAAAERTRAVTAAFERLVRESLGLPRLTFE